VANLSALLATANSHLTSVSTELVATKAAAADDTAHQSQTWAMQSQIHSLEEELKAVREQHASRSFQDGQREDDLAHYRHLADELARQADARQRDHATQACRAVPFPCHRC
jgi:hypothetical protein